MLLDFRLEKKEYMAKLLTSTDSIPQWNLARDAIVESRADGPYSSRKKWNNKGNSEHVKFSSVERCRSVWGIVKTRRFMSLLIIVTVSMAWV